MQNLVYHTCIVQRYGGRPLNKVKPQSLFSEVVSVSPLGESEYTFYKSPCKQEILHMAVDPDELYWLGGGLTGQGKYKEAQKLFEDSIPLFQASGNWEYVALAQNNIGFVLGQVGRIEQAIASYHNAYQLFDQIGDREGAANALQSVGRLYLERQDFPSAIAIYREVVLRFDDLRDVVEAAISRFILASALLRGNAGIADVLDFRQSTIYIGTEWVLLI
jgi:tetratricopeptide (TPR) repeat protein